MAEQDRARELAHKLAYRYAPDFLYEESRVEILADITAYGNQCREEALREAAEACWCNGCRNRILALLDQPQEPESR